MNQKVDKRASKMFMNVRNMQSATREGGSRVGDTRAGTKRFYKKVANRSLRYLPFDPN